MKLDICSEVQWQTQGKAYGRWFSHPRTFRRPLERSSIPETPKTWELNNLELLGADIGNASLETYTHEKLFIIAGAEFEELESFILIFNKALYGLKSSGKKRGERLHHITKDMGFMPSKADPCVWMRENMKLKCYEYITTNLSEMLSKHWEIIKILPMIIKLLIPYDPIDPQVIN